MKRLLSLSFGVVLLCSGCRSFDPLEVTQSYMSGSESLVLPYRVYTPEIVTNNVYPVCIYLHDSDSSGNNNKSQLDEGATDLIKYVKNSDTPAFVIIPQCPKGKQWKDDDMLVALDDLVGTWLKKDVVDKSRIYMTGFGMGGEGTWSYVTEFPDNISTIAPVCGGSLAIKQTKDPIVPMALSEMNIWAIHYLDDRVRTSDLSKKILSGVWTQNVALSRLTEFPSGGHTPVVYKDAGFLGWLFATRRASEERKDNGN